MLFDWIGPVIQWYTEASEYTGFSRALAAMLLPKLRGCETLCDIGCGLGLVDFELARSIPHVICADVSPQAIAYIKSRCEAEGVNNLNAVCADGLGLSGSWDAVTAMFHGHVPTIVPNYLQKARDRLILVVHGSAVGTTGPEGYRIRKCGSVDEAAAWLDAHSYRYDYEYGELEFGQPHRDFEDAVAYTRTNSAGAPEAELRRHVERTVQSTGRADFPLYTPKTKRFGIFTLKAAENRALL